MDAAETTRSHGRRLDELEARLAAVGERVAVLEVARAAPPVASRRVDAAAETARRPPAGEAARRSPAAAWHPPAADTAWRPPAGAAAPAGPSPARSAPAPAPTPPPPPPWPVRKAAPASPPRPRVDLEDLLGGRVLGIAGALAVLLGVAFLVAMAVDRGWIDEPTRIAIGFGGCTALLAGAVALYERRGRTQAALAAAGSAIAGLFATLTAGAQLYDLFPVPVSLATAALVGGVATVLALRWNARTFAALGLVGALLAPVLVGADQTGLTTSFVLLVLGAAVAVAVARRWGWLALAASSVAAPQVAAWLVGVPAELPTLAVLSLFWVANVAAAAGLDRAGAGARAAEPTAGEAPAGLSAQAPTVPTLLLLGTALFVAPAGYLALQALDLDGHAVAWVAAAALAHLALGIGQARDARSSRPLAYVTLALGLVLGDVAFGLAADGAALAVGWAASTVALAGVARTVRSEESQPIAVAAAAQLALSVVHVLAVDAQPGELSGPHADLLASVASLTAVGAAAVAGVRIATRDRRARATGHGLALVVVGYLTAFLVDGSALTVAWAVEAVAALALAGAGGARPEPVLAGGAVGLLGLAAIHGVAFEAVPTALVYGVEDLPEAAASFLALAAAAIKMSRLVPRDRPDERLAFASLGAAALVYLVSVAVVTAFQPGDGAIDESLGLLDVRQQGQLVLSAFWAVTGVGALLAGLALRRRAVRIGGFVLLGIATAKVFLYDLAALESLYRVGSFVALGLLLLGAAFAWQRTRRPAEVRTSS
ncbi:MAG TPA: DUF2339 domain-containing protein [Thermoleophilaceae bacterium]